MSLIHISITDRTSKPYDVDIDPNLTVEDLKQEIGKTHNCDPDLIKLIFRSRVLNGKQYLKDVDVVDGSAMKIFINTNAKRTPSNSQPSVSPTNATSQISQPSSQPSVSPTNATPQFSQPSSQPYFSPTNATPQPNIVTPASHQPQQTDNYPPLTRTFAKGANYNIIMQLRKELLDQGFPAIQVDNFIYLCDEYIEDVQTGLDVFYQFLNIPAVDLSNSTKVNQVKSNPLFKFFSTYHQMAQAYKGNTQTSELKYPWSNPVKSIRQQFSELTQEQQHECNILYIEGYDMDKAVQAYIDASCNLETARQILHYQ